MVMVGIEGGDGDHGGTVMGSETSKFSLTDRLGWLLQPTESVCRSPYHGHDKPPWFPHGMKNLGNELIRMMTGTMVIMTIVE